MSNSSTLSPVEPPTSPQPTNDDLQILRDSAIMSNYLAPAIIAAYHTAQVAALYK
jgi:hypothetical protein